MESRRDLITHERRELLRIESIIRAVRVNSTDRQLHDLFKDVKGIYQSEKKLEVEGRTS